MSGLGIAYFFLILLCVFFERVYPLEQLRAFLEHLLLFLLESLAELLLPSLKLVRTEVLLEDHALLLVLAGV